MHIFNTKLELHSELLKLMVTTLYENMMHLQRSLVILFGVLTIINGIYSQKNVDVSSVVSENSQELQKRPALSAVNRPARQQRPSQSGFGGLLSGKFYTS